MPEKPGWSGSWLHQMKIGLPTMWSSGTKPQKRESAELSRLSPRSRRRRVYKAIEGIEADSDSAHTMLEILYDVFRHSLRGTIGYVPDVYLGRVLVLQPEHGVDGFYPSLGGDVDWPGTVLGELETATVRGSHATCLLEGNVESIIRYFDESR